ncbi:signal peptidase I [Actinomyces sp. oral taxon 897]|nr:signal peptidase I [Actinomyces sp. oral taxon 897]
MVPFVVILLLVALFKTFVIQYFEIPTGSMESTLVNGDRVAVTMYDSDDIKRGDIIVFRDPDHWLNSIDPTGLRGLIRDGLILIRILPEDSGHHLIKRVIGMPGDRVVSDGRGTVSVNGVVLHETYVKAGVSPSEVAFDVTVPDSMVWVMGDNRSNSADSRAHMDDVHGGFVPLSDVVGVAKSIIWPVSRWDGLGEGEDVFAGVPAAR